MPIIETPQLQLLIVFTAFFMLIVVMTAIMLLYINNHKVSRYDKKMQMAILSEMRESYENQMARLSKQLVATEDRWREVNHLVVSGQSAPQRRSRGAPEVTSFLNRLGISGEELYVDQKLIFVLTPFSSEEASTFLEIRNACAELGFKAVRGDEEFAHGDILKQIIQQMVKSRVVIANITSRNANVMYELGIAHAIGKPTIIISKSTAKLPFDVQSRRIIIYEFDSQLPEILSKNLLRTISETE